MSSWRLSETADKVWWLNEIKPRSQKILLAFDLDRSSGSSLQKICGVSGFTFFSSKNVDLVDIVQLKNFREVNIFLNSKISFSDIVSEYAHEWKHRGGNGDVVLEFVSSSSGWWKFEQIKFSCHHGAFRRLLVKCDGWMKSSREVNKFCLHSIWIDLLGHLFRKSVVSLVLHSFLLKTLISLTSCN